MSDRRVAGLLAAMAYIPMALTSPGRISADTKTYLTLDPGGVLSSAATMWDPSTGAGTVPHQNIGYLFPLGPYYWLLDRVGVPDWIAQRALWGTLAFAAAYGAYRLARWLGWQTSAALVVGAAYGFTPYLLSYLARLSAILGPWAAMPWMILLAAQAARTRSWRPAAMFAVVVALVGSVNATSLVFAGLGPVLWLVADVAARRVSVGSATRAASRIGVLSAGVSAWWVAGLSVQGAFGLPILRYTETYQAVASSSTAPEILRGLGYWFFYGGDRLDGWVGPAEAYIDHPAVMLLGFGIATISLLGICTNFAGRASAALLLLVGLTLSVGAAPLDGSSWYGSLFETFATDTTTGAALRSTPRAAPLVILALAFGLGGAVQWLSERLADRDAPAAAPAVGAVGLVMLQLFPWFTGNAATASLLRDDQVPVYEQELAGWLNDTGDGRVYAIPGSDFANYRWGGTVDPVLAGLVDRPVLYRELVPQGGDGTADLLNAFERRLSEGWFEPESLPVIADLFDVDTVVTRNDLEHERYRLARPGALWTDVTEALGAPDHVGPIVADRPTIPYVDEPLLARPDAALEFPVVAAFDLDRSGHESVGPISVIGADAPLVVAGSGDGLVDLAGAGLLDTNRPVLYLGTLDAAGEATGDAVGTGTHWIVTDTNRKQGRHWSTIGSNLGALESLGPLSLDPDPGDSRLEPFPTDSDGQTIAVHRGDVADVRASYYGNKIAYTPEDAPFFAIDGDPATAWRAGVFDEAIGLVWEMDLVEPSNAPTITVLQPTTGAVNRFITSARITLDGNRSVDVVLDETSRSAPGQTIGVPAGDPFTSVRIEVLGDNLGPVASYAGRPGVGLAEVSLDGVVDDRVVRMPQLGASPTFVDNAGPTPAVSFLMTRQRIDPATPNRTAPEPTIVREFDVPNDAAFVLDGEARLSSSVTDDVWSRLLGQGAPVVADRRLPGSFDSRGASAFDADLTTAWQTPFDDSVGAAVTVHQPVVSSQVSITWLDDDRHSAPTQFTMSGDGGAQTLTAPELTSLDGLTTATFDIGEFSSASATISINEIEPTTSAEYFSGVEQVLPVAIAEIDFGDAALANTLATAPAIGDECRLDLIAVDGNPIGVRLVAPASVTDRTEIAVEACDGSLELDAGPHRIETTHGAASGFDIDRIVLLADAADPDAASGPDPALPELTESRSDATHHDVTVSATSEPFWLTLDQSWNAGWTASLDGSDLGEPTLINGYANGWLLPASADTQNVSLEWTPQRRVDIGLAISAVFAAAVVALLIWSRRRDSDESAEHDGETSEAAAQYAPLTGSPVLAVVATGCMLVVGGPAAAVTAVLALLAAAKVRWFGPLVVTVSVSAIAIGVVGLEWRRDYPIGPDWPSRFEWATPLAWIAVAAVAIPALLGGCLRRRNAAVVEPIAIADGDVVAR